MCGRFAIQVPGEELAAHFNLKAIPEIEPRYNIAPSQQVNIVKGISGEFILSSARWGLIPHWAKDEKIGYKLINARAETVSEKPSFRSAFKQRRCLIPASGFYEWKKVGSQKQPYYFQLKGSPVFAMAGLWETWKSSTGETVESFTIITTEANDIVSQIHNRMPVIIPREGYNKWFSLENAELLKPYKASAMISYPVNQLVNNPRNNGPECIQEIE